LATATVAAESTSASNAVAQKKAAGKTAHGHGTPAGLRRVSGKAQGAFARLVAATAGQEAGAQPVELVKSALAAAVKAAHEGDAKGATAPGALTAAALKGALAGQAAHHAGDGAAEKADGKKKPLKHLSLAALALSADTAQGTAKADHAKGDEGQTPAQAGVAASGAHRGAAPQAHAKVMVVDLRRKATEGVSADAAQGPGGPQGTAADKPSPATILLRATGREAPVEAAAKQAPTAPASHAAPLDRLREMAGSELLRASTMVLRDGGGEIRLLLKPESLGSVRIRMNLLDNSIDGKIIVDSASVKQVFDGNIDALKRALTAEGFQMGSLQVSVGGQGTGSDARGEDQERPAAVSRAAAAEDFQRSVPGIETMSLGELMVNLFA
jgi:flagellar protein FlbC